MHDFDYDAMQKKRTASGAIHKKNEKKSKRCSLPHDGLTPAQLRRLNGPVHTYKLDGPMSWADFKAMPLDLQKDYIRNLQDLYQVNDGMLGQMFGVADYIVRKWRSKNGVASLGKERVKDKEREIRLAKWSAFCNGVIGGGDRAVEHHGIADCCSGGPDDSDKTTEDNIWSTQVINSLKDKFEQSEKAIVEPEVVRPIKSQLEFVADILDADSIANLLRNQCLPIGKCRVKIEIERED